MIVSFCFELGQCPLGFDAYLDTLITFVAPFIDVFAKSAPPS